MTNMSFGENLKQSRNENHLTQEMLAELLDVSRQAVSKWELGNGYPKIEKLTDLAKILNISLDRLFAEELAKEENLDVQKRTLPGAIAGLKAFATATDNLIEQIMPKT
jgi:transcriptional regulator with XRE-family HTH domain